MIQQPLITYQEKTCIFYINQVHKQPITGIHTSPCDQNLFLTISEDQSMRLFDLRLNSSVKLFQFPPNLNQQLQTELQTANCLLNNNNVYGVLNNLILMYDLRQEIIIKEVKKINEIESDINQIQFNQGQSKILVNCDSGNSYILDQQLQLQSQLLNGHKTVCFTGDFVHDELCITSGFDYTLVLWKYGPQPQIQCKNDLTKIHAKYSGISVTPPIVYSVNCKKSEILISTETGLIYNFNIDELKQKKNRKLPVPTYVIDGHTSKVMRSIFYKDRILSISNDKSLAFWDKNQLIERIAIPNKPNWMDVSEENNKIMVADVSSKLYIYSL